MKKLIKYYWILLIPALALMITGAALWKTNEIVGIVLACVGVGILIVYGILDPYAKNTKTNEQKKERAVAEKQENSNLEIHKDDNTVTKVIYAIYKGEYVEISKLLEESICDVEFDYDEEDCSYALGITSMDFKNKANPLEFMLVLSSSDKAKTLIVNNKDEDISSLSEEDIVLKVVEALKNGIKPYTVESFEIKRPKREFIMSLCFIILAVIAIPVLIVLGVLNILNATVAYASLCIPALFLFAGIWNLFVCINQRFVYTGKEFEYYNFANKKHSCKIGNVKKVYFDFKGKGITVTFANKDGESLLQFHDDAWVVKDKNFLYALSKHHIKKEGLY